ncbi:hypothetical protein GOBAR_DD10838 [Gossypium barbadense]|nr:hypothetical protein GOBAR_DD10838 [Gossypium barbadense]
MQTMKKGPDNDVHSHYDGEEYSDPNQDEVPDNIDDKGIEDGENLQPPLVEHSSHEIILRNDLGADMLSVDLDATHALEFPEYEDILPAHRLMASSETKDLFVG